MSTHSVVAFKSCWLHAELLKQSAFVESVILGRRKGRLLRRTSQHVRWKVYLSLEQPLGLELNGQYGMLVFKCCAQLSNGCCRFILTLLNHVSHCLCSALLNHPDVLLCVAISKAETICGGARSVQGADATGIQSSIAFSTQSWGAIIAPVFIGLIADKYFNAEKILGILHLIGGYLMIQLHQSTSFDLFYPLKLNYHLRLARVTKLIVPIPKHR